MKTYCAIVSTIISMMLFSIHLSADPSIGNIGFTGGVVFDTTSAATATAVSSFTNPMVTLVSGAFSSILPGTPVAITPFSFGSGGPSWSVGGFAFNPASSFLYSQGGVPGSSGYVVVKGTGSLSGNGFASALMAWSFTSQDPKSGNNPDSWTLSASVILPPVAQSQSISIQENSTAHIGLTGVDSNRLVLTFILLDPPKDGVITMFNTNTGSLEYTPNTGFSGTDGFTFSVNNGFVESASATVAITMTNQTVLITGHVYSSCDGSPIAGASVQIGTHSATTASDGGYTMNNISAGAYPTTISDSGYVSSTKTTTINSGPNQTQNFTLTPLASVTGKVTCTCDGSPVIGVTVQIGSQSRVTDNNGNYSISGLSAGMLPVIINGPGYNYTNLPNMTISSSCSPTTSDFALRPTGKNSTETLKILSGAVTWDYTSNPKTLTAKFVPQIQGMTLDTAACFLGYTHFNWYQRVLIAPHPGPYAFQAPWNDPPEYLADGSPDLLRDTVAPHLPKWPADGLIFLLNEGNNPADPYDRQSPNHTQNGGTLLRFDDSPGDPLLEPGEYIRFVTALVGIRNDGSYDVLSIFFWRTTNTGSFGGIAPDILTEAVPTNGIGGVVEVITNVGPASLSSDIVASMLASGGSFPITVQPASQTVVSGASVAFTLSPTNSSSPLNYQWRFNGTNILNATNLTLAIPSATTNSIGDYDAILSDNNGSIASAVATLMVLNNPLFQPAVFSTNGLVLAWSAAQGKAYQLQYITNLIQTNWVNLGDTITASSVTVSVTNNMQMDEQRFYRVQQQ